MGDQKGYFTADYRDGRVHLDGKIYPAGYFAVHLLNKFYDNHTGGRISIFREYGWLVMKSIRVGYLYERDFLKAGQDILYILDTLPKLRPFDLFNAESERERVQKLFRKETCDDIQEYYRRRIAVYQMDELMSMYGTTPKEYDKAFFDRVQGMLADIKRTLAFYDSLGDDVIRAFEKLRAFVKRVDEAERFDEEHLLPIALEVFGAPEFPAFTEYVGIRKSSRSKVPTVARRLHFESYYGFILTDFFEGLHYGHYPRQCEICESYFLMTCARRQRYCNGLSPYMVRGKKLPCNKYAAAVNRKERAADDPVTDRYNRRCAAIRTEKGRGTITEEFAKAAKALALEHKLRAKTDIEYANAQYERDMSREKLYADADQRMG